MKSFTEFTLSPILQSNLAKHGFTEPTPVQALAIEPALAGKNVVATAQTGTGKTLAFVLPMLQSILKEPAKKGVRVLVLSPTRELAIQTHETFLKMAAGTGIRAAIVVGGLGENPQLQSIRKGAQVVIATPGRLYDFLSRQLVELGAVQMLVLDEADRMLDMGFLPTIKRIMARHARRSPDAVLFGHHRKFGQAPGRDHVPNAVRVEVGSITKPVDQVDLRLYEVDRTASCRCCNRCCETRRLVPGLRPHQARRRPPGEAALARGREDRRHPRRPQPEPAQPGAARAFRKGYYRVLVATDVAARGIHVDGISHVVNYDLPQVPEDFIHRVGRTGRAGARGMASTFATRMERTDIALIERTLGIRLTRQNVSREIGGEQLAQVIEIPISLQPPAKRFVFRSRNRRSVRRAI